MRTYKNRRFFPLLLILVVVTAIALVILLMYPLSTNTSRSTAPVLSTSAQTSSQSGCKDTALSGTDSGISFKVPVDRISTAAIESTAINSYKTEYQYSGKTEILVSGNGTPKIWRIDLEGHVVRELQTSGFVYCATVLHNGNILSAEYGNKIIREYDEQDSVVWTSEGIELSGCVDGIEEEANGNILIAHTDGTSAFEINRQRQIMWKYPTKGMPSSAQRLANGNTLISLDGMDRVVELNSRHEIVYEVDGLSGPHDAVRLHSGTTLISDFVNNRVVEADKNGRIIREVTINGPCSARQLPDGNLVVSSWSEGVVVLNFEGTLRSIIFPGHNLGKATLVPAESGSIETVPPSTEPVSPDAPPFQSARSKQRSTIKCIFGPIGSGSVHALQQTVGGGFALAASIYHEGDKESYLYLLTTDVNGKCLQGWPKILKATGEPLDSSNQTRESTSSIPNDSLSDTTKDNHLKGTFVRCAFPTKGGGFVVAGTSNNTGDWDIYLSRIDPQGKIIPGWPKTFGGSKSDWPLALAQTKDGGFILSCATYSLGAGERDFYLLRTDAFGNSKPGWPKTYGGAKSEEATVIAPTRDGGCMVAGWTDRAGKTDALLIRTNSVGNVMPGWPRIFDKVVPSSIQQTLDGGFIVTGSARSTGPRGNDVFLLRTDAKGNPLKGWPKTFGGESTDYGSSVRLTNDNGFIISGGSHSTRGEFGSAYLLKTDAEGNPMQGWPNHYGDGSASASCVLQMPNGGFTVAGTMLDDSEEEKLLFLLFTDQNGAIK